MEEIRKVIDWMNALTIDLREAQKASERYFAAIYSESHVSSPYVRPNKSTPFDDKIIDLLRGEGAYKLYSLKNRQMIWNKWRQRLEQETSGGSMLTFRNVDLSGLDLTDFDLSHMDLSGAKLKDAKLNGVNLRRTNLAKCNLHAAKLINCDLTEALLPLANLTGAFIHGGRAFRTLFMKADFTNATVFGIDVSGSNFEYAKLEWAKEFQPLNVNQSDFVGTGLKFSDLKRKKIAGVETATFDR
ncbi:pentapeptide repeat-containing protein [Candidatus Woesearchaeota archaeon]|nr:pentapeptide repeat-containing protein [Candidatus Woesearchaeota archaeon]